MLTGMIMIWSGAIVDIPFGWHLCDGTMGTPDLRNQFIVGAGDTYDPDDTGGALTHNHTFTGDGHTHDLIPGPDIAAGAVFDKTSSNFAVTGTTHLGGNMPPYYALAFIMKL